MVAQLEREVSCRSHSRSRSHPRKKHTGNFGSRAAFAGRDHDEQLHDGVIDPWATGLDDEDILLPDTLEDLDTRLALLR